ncbi:coatomer subunit epsilon isoform X1 [Lutzomyia longipalpis]|uniref:coatomer subunit epsilon isoform X1 n=1 Tax=Lutzomyia longipalpis TaxID=7200 RepID=UPI00248396AE|nr:coatomer subunit epsilon isoform X1 [Lutzomyia longipalpis]
MDGAKAGNELFLVRNHFYLGNFQECINQVQKIKSPSVEKDMFLYRSYIGQKQYGIVLDEVKNSSELYPIRLIAEYFSQQDRKAAIVQQVDDYVEKHRGSMDLAWIVAAGTIYFQEGLYENCLRCKENSFQCNSFNRKYIILTYFGDFSIAGEDLESLALSIQSLLKLNRVDLAKKTYETMQKTDEDATLTQLALAWIFMEVGGEKLQDAFYIFQEFSDKYTPTVQLLNGQAVCLIGQEKYEEAESTLREALNKDPNNYDTLINLMALSQQQETGWEIPQRYLTQLRENYRDSPFIREYTKKESDFDTFAQQYAPSKSLNLEAY